MRRELRKKFICIICPVGCPINAALKGRKIMALHGAKCSKGEAYVRGELAHPRRVLTTTVRVKEGHLDLVSVRTLSAIPRGKLLPAMKILSRKVVKAPVCVGDVIMKNLLDTGVNVIATKNIRRKRSKRPRESGITVF